MKSPILNAVGFAGSQSELARRLARIAGCGLTPQAVQRWCASNHVPARWVIPVEKAVEAHVTRYQLRPDLYPRA